VSLRRLFWRGAAAVFSIAALVGIAAVLGGDFGETQWKTMATCAIAFVCGSAALAGFACLERRVWRPAGIAALALGVVAFVTWTVALWDESGNDSLWKVNGVLGAWLLAALAVTTLRLFATSPRLLATLVPATAAGACLSALVGTGMILAENGELWQLLAVLVILTVLGYVLTPVLQHLTAEGAPPTDGGERVLGTLGDVDVIAARGDERSVRIGERSVRLQPNETVVLRPKAR
jgi:hypothetical protein